MKICLLMNMAPRYVASAYTLFDRELDIQWCFGSNDTDIKEMDHSLLKDVKVLPTKKLYKGAYYLKGALNLAFRRDITNYILIGEPAMLTTWIFPWLVRLFRPSSKIIFWTHGWYGKEGKLKSIIKKLYFLPAHNILTYGDRARNLMIDVGFKPDKVKAIHNSLDHTAQVKLRNNQQSTAIYKEHFGNNAPVIIFIGRLTAVKKLDMLIEAVDLLKQKGSIYNVIFVGDGSEKESLEKLVNDKGLNDQVWFYGACYDEKQNAELIFNADLCVAPGNIGLTAMHVMAFGTPALTHNDFSWQMPEYEAIHPGITGCFFDRNNTESLAKAIDDWFSDKSDKREEIRLACYKEIDENWTPEFELNVLKQVVK